MSQKKVICQPWREYERGWGNRPDGYSLHLSLEDRDAFVQGYDAVFNNEAEAPDEYSKADGDPYVVLVDEKVYENLLSEKSSKNHDYEFRQYGTMHPNPIPAKATLDETLA